MTIQNILGLDASELEWHQMLARAIVVYVAALIFVRVAGMRTFGTSSAFDVVVTITMGAVLGRSILGGVSFAGCLVSALAIALSHRLIAFANFRSRAIRKLVEGDPILLYSDGKIINQNLKKHSIHHEDISRSMREENIDDISKVKSIWYESDGSISIVKKDKN